MSVLSKGLNNPANSSMFIKGLNKLIRYNFKDSKLFSVVSNLKKYRVREDPFVFGQKIGKVPEFADIYLNNEYLCEVREDMRPEEVLAVIQYHLLEKLKVKNTNGKLDLSSK
jgi:hypothetical protein